MTHTDPRTWKS